MWVNILLSLLVGCVVLEAAHLNEKVRTTSVKNATPGYRLPRNVELEMVQVHIEPFFENNTFQGFDLTNGRLIEETDKIILHSKDLFIATWSLMISKENVSESTVLSYDLEKDFLIFTMNQSYPAGVEFALQIGFIGELKDDKTGFYRAKYIDENGLAT